MQSSCILVSMYVSLFVGGVVSFLPSVISWAVIMVFTVHIKLLLSSVLI